MKRIVLAAFLFALFVPSTSTASPLYCPAPEVPEALRRAGAVFVGEVSEVIEPLTSDINAPLPDHFYTVKFKVEKAWKGVSGLEMNVLAPTSGYETMPLPVKGEKYLVYANPAYTTEGPRKDWLIMGSMCNRSMLLSRANYDIQELEAIAKSCPENSSKAEEVDQRRDQQSSLKKSQDTLQLPWYIITMDDPRSIDEYMLRRKKVLNVCYLCQSLK